MLRSKAAAEVDNMRVGLSLWLRREEKLYAENKRKVYRRKGDE